MKLPEVIALDTNCFIYFFEGTSHRRADFLADHVFGPLAAGRCRAVTSTVTMAELLSRPYQQGRHEQAKELRAAVEAMPNLAVLPVDLDVADRAARVRGDTGLRLPNALQVATAVAGGAGALVTNDRDVVRASAVGMPVLVLDDLVAS